MNPSYIPPPPPPTTSTSNEVTQAGTVNEASPGVVNDDDVAAPATDVPPLERANIEASRNVPEATAKIFFIA
jgi:hypothetical protein